MANEGLTDQQRLFCLEYLKDHNGKQAAIRAGYSEKTAEVQASRLLSNVKVSAFIQEKQSKVEKKLELSAEKILRDIEETRIRCMQGEPVLDSEGNPTGEWTFQASAALKASELQGKYKKLWTDKIEHSGQPYDGWTKDQLKARLKDLRKKFK
jgi:phage terminase small subunit